MPDADLEARLIILADLLDRAAADLRKVIRDTRATRHETTDDQPNGEAQP